MDIIWISDGHVWLARFPCKERGKTRQEDEEDEAYYNDEMSKNAEMKDEDGKNLGGRRLSVKGKTKSGFGIERVRNITCSLFLYDQPLQALFHGERFGLPIIESCSWPG